MQLWYAGSFGIGNEFSLMRDEGILLTYTLDINGRQVKVEADPECEQRDPEKSVQVFKTSQGRFIFPWVWGNSSRDWPRFEKNLGATQLITLTIERGMKVVHKQEHSHWMRVIQHNLDQHTPGENLFRSV